MIFADQEFLAEGGAVGDCWRACVASMYGRPIAEVPHFVEQYDNDWLTATNEWLRREHGEQLQEAVTRLDSCRPYVILVGPSPRNVSHAVIADSSTLELVHDPHPSRAGLLSAAGIFVPRLVTP